MNIYDIFLAVAYGPACVEGSRYHHAIESFLNISARTGLSMYVAPANEAWGLRRPPRKQAIAQDHTALRQCTCFVYFTGGFESDGALVELGIALAWRKRIVVLRWASEELPSHVAGLINIGPAEECVLPPERSLDQVWSNLLLRLFVRTQNS
jgi:hypothetical protein